MSLQPTSIDAKSSADSEEQPDAQKIAEQLLEPSAYPYQSDAVELIETHISWVFLTDRHAYKVKKPVRFEFLDFSTLDKRYEVCLDEIQLNRRLAPNVYVDVQPITRDNQGGLHIGGDGVVVEWAVRMRRLDESSCLQSMILNETVDRHDIKILGDHLLAFYNRLAPELVHIDVHRQQTEEHICRNWDELRSDNYQLCPDLVDRIHQSQLQFLRLHSELLDSRALDGRIIEGHGDLRPEHIYFAPSPVVIDCLEFNREFRILDVYDEVNFLAMECERLGAHEIAAGILNAYIEASGDKPNPRLGSFYRSYRACVRAKVAALRSQQQSGQEAEESLNLVASYLQIADAEAKMFSTPLMLITSGLSGSGKTTLASELAASLQIEHLETDVVRRQIHDTEHSSDYGEGAYSPSNRDQVYTTLLMQAEEELSDGLSVVVDGTFLKQEWRDKALQVAQACGAEAIFVECSCPDEVARLRIAKRLKDTSNLSQARPEFYDRQVADREQLATNATSCKVDTTVSAPLMLKTVFNHVSKTLATKA